MGLFLELYLELFLRLFGPEKLVVKLQSAGLQFDKTSDLVWKADLWTRFNPFPSKGFPIDD